MLSLRSMGVWTLLSMTLICNINSITGANRVEDEILTFGSPTDPPPHLHGKTCYVFWSKEKGYEVKVFGVGFGNFRADNLDWIAKAHYQNFVNKTGWAFLEVETKTTWPDDMQATAAGISEGYLTRDLIYDSWQNTIQGYCDQNPILCKNIFKFIDLNFQWMKRNINNRTSYWHHTNLVLEQMNGLVQGYNLAAKDTQKNIPDRDFVMMNLLGDWADLASAPLNPNPNMRMEALLKRQGHCSALIKLIGNHDIYFSHVTWNKLESMLRIIKRYNFAYKLTADPGSRIVPAESISFSSYPGMIYSMDDFYVLSSGLSVMETTIINYSMERWAKVKPDNSLFSGIRSMVANRLAKSGQMWTRLFARYNSGTYNNQWMIVDYNYFEPGKELRDSGILWVLEQLPGMIVSRDVTRELQKNGYFASYNLPYFKEIFEASGTPDMVSQYGDFFSFESTPRARIFAREQTNVVDMESMMKVMRYNDYTHDEFAKCECNPPYSAVCAISSRADLNPANGTYPIPSLGHRSSAGTDMKITNLDLSILQQFVAISGPTFDPLPAFQWSTSDFKDNPHFGHPDKFEFPPVIHNWKWL